MHHRDHRYSWYRSDKHIAVSELDLTGGGQCGGSDCDTESLVDAANREKLCAGSGWRVPTRTELPGLAEAKRCRHTVANQKE